MTLAAATGAWGRAPRTHGNLAKIGEVRPGRGFDALLNANGFDHALLWAAAQQRSGAHRALYRQISQ